MKHLNMLLLIVILSITYADAFAHDQELHKGKPIIGVIEKIDNNEFKLETESKSYLVTLNATTKFEISNVESSAESLKEGQKVKVFGTKLPKAKIVASEILIGSDSAPTSTTTPTNKNLLSYYLKASESLASDNAVNANTALIQLRAQLEKEENPESIKAATTLASISTSTKITTSRKVFGDISKILIPRLESKKDNSDLKFHKAYCPMALDGKGAEWLQAGKEIRNPYFGDTMLACGELAQTKRKEDHTNHNH